MASFSSTHMDDNLRSEIALSVEEAIRSPLEEIREAMGEMVQAIHSLHVTNERREQETRAVMKKKAVEDPEIGQGRLIDMIMSRTLLQGTLMEGGLIIGIRATKKIKKEIISIKGCLREFPFPSLMQSAKRLNQGLARQVVLFLSIKSYGRLPENPICYPKP
eukprot:Gb_11874 [translate_table: standard]